MATDPLAQSLSFQAEACRQLGSPLNGALLDAAADDLAAGGPVAGLLAPWAGQDLPALINAAVPLRLIAALHDLALSGDDPALAEAYAAGEVWPAGRAAIQREPARLAAFMDHEPQTNEVRRSACLLPGFLEIAKATGLPLRCFEIGASAGLNQNWDRFHYALGGAAWGDPASPVQLDTDWTGPPPPVEAPIRVVARAACDRRPVDLSDPIQRRRLMAYVWADQPERLARLTAAIEVALAHGVAVERADAAEWTARRVTLAPGAATVLYHSSVWPYLPPATQASIAGTCAALGARATPDAPFAWLRKEPPPEDPIGDELTLTFWPGGETHTLAAVHPHGAWIRWKGVQ